MDDFETSYWHSLDRQAAQNLSVPPSKLGIPTHPAKDQLQGLKTRVFQGAQAVEIGFFGRGKGGLEAGNIVPGMYGREEREAMKDLAKINKVQLSTHGTIQAVTGLAGQAEGGFSEQVQQETIDELKQTIDFAGEVAGGGPVVIHTNEFHRPASETPDGMFQAYPGEKEKAPVSFVDKTTGRLMQIPRETILPFPETEIDPATGKEIPKLDPRTGIPKIESQTVAHWMKIEEEKLQKAGVQGDPALPALGVLNRYHERQRQEAQGEAERWSLAYEDARDKLQLTKHALEHYDNLSDEVKRKMGSKEEIAHAIPHLEKEEGYYLKNAKAMAMQLSSIEEEKKKHVPIATYALDKTKDSLAQLGVYAMEKTTDPKRPVFISPENMDSRFGYGGHPEELKNIVLESRKAMADKLVKDKGFSQEAAEKTAAEHIKATFDIGHAYTWKKYFTGKPEEFDAWLLKQVDKLNKDGIIGHVHITDNFGYSDEHLTPGEGSVPLKDFLAKMQAKGYKEPVIVEPAHQDWQAMTGAWKHLNSPAYRIDATAHTWTDVAGGYFGQTRSPNYLFGETAPDQKTWTLWSEVPLE